MAVAPVLLCAIACTGCDLLFDIDHVERARADAPPAISDGDGGDIDGPPGAARFVFATSLTRTGQLGGLAGADAFCQQRASFANLPGPYMAWLSTSAASPATRMTRSEGPYKLVNGATVANNWADLTDGTLRTPINIDESGQGAAGEYICRIGQVWSNTDVQGNAAGANSCNDWTSATASGSAALLTETNADWTAPSCFPILCSNVMPIYCFQQ